MDEFQDTDPLQAEILLVAGFKRSNYQRLAFLRHPCPGKLFIVGDPKQSIYRFRRADVGAYLVCLSTWLGTRRHAHRAQNKLRSLRRSRTQSNAAFGPAHGG